MNGTEVRRWIAIGEGVLEPGDVAGWLDDPGAGAHALFCGVVRENDGERSGVVALDYDAYEPFASNALDEIATSIVRDFPTTRSVALLHRTGRLIVGEVAVIVGIGAAHRDEVFGATSAGIDRIKGEAPIFKSHEYFADDEELPS